MRSKNILWYDSNSENFHRAADKFNNGSSRQKEARRSGVGLFDNAVHIIK